MVLRTQDLFSNNFFKSQAEDGQIGQYYGNRIEYTNLPGQILTPLESALNILQLQVAATITPGDYVGIEMDIFSDTTGYLNTVDTATTTALFSTNNYTNKSTTFNTGNPGGTTNATSITNTCTAIKKGFISYVRNIGTYVNQSTYKCDIIQGGVTLATKSDTKLTADFIFTFTEADYSANGVIQPGTFSIVITRTSGSTQLRVVNAPYSYSSVAWSYTNQTVSNYNMIFTTLSQDSIVQTNAITIAAGFENFQVTSFRGATTGTGTINASISFDGGTNYQTFTVNENHSINYPGTSMIVKIQLNAGASAGEAECMGWGVQLW